eukprot:g875.t1
MNLQPRLFSACLLLAAVQSLCPTVEIADGIYMPMVNLGHPDGNNTINETASLELWLSDQVNGSGIDTALDYQNQEQVGKAMRASGRSRSSMFLLTKIPNVLSREDTLKYIKTDIAQLGETPDLVLIHSPCYTGFPSGGCTHASREDMQQAWLGMEDALKAGLTRSIGVSNFLSKDLQPILDMGGTVPSVNQCEMYVGNHDDETRDFCNKHKIVYESYMPLGRGNLNVHDARIEKIAKAHGKSVFQVCLRWVIQTGSPMAVSATKLSHDLSDLDIFDFQLTDSEMATLDKM